MSQHISIGRFSLLSGLSVRALRLYDELEILKPAVVTPHNQYRYYHHNQLETAQKIKGYRNLELPLEQIKIICHNPQVAQSILQDHLGILQQAMFDYNNKIRELEQMLHQ
jgi:DNA-binding transcriptional MerR regulator